MTKGIYLDGSKVRTSQYSLFASLLDSFREKASVLDAIFSHIEYSDLLRGRFLDVGVRVCDFTDNLTVFLQIYEKSIAICSQKNTILLFLDNKQKL